MMNSTNTTDTRKAITQQLCRGFFALFIGFISCTNAFADWPLGFGGDDDVDVWDIQTDPLGGVVVVGTFTGTARFEDQGFGPTQLLVSEGDTDIFVAKYAASGNLLWVTQAGGAGNDNPHKMAIDDDGTIVVVGSFLYTARFGKYTLPGCGNYENVFISRLDKDGEWLPPATIETCSGPAVAVDTESGGNGIYVAIDNDVSRAEFSRWNVVPAFNPGTEIISYDSVNSWTAKVGTLGPHANEITGIAAADDGKIYVASFKKQGADETFCGTKIVVGSQYISMWEESSPPPVPGQPLSHSITCKWLVAVDDRNVIRQHDRGKEGKRDIPALVTDGSSAYFHYKGRFVKVDQNGIVYTDDFTSETFMVNGFGLAVDQLGNAVVSGTVNPENRTMVIGEGSASPLTLSALPAFTYDPFIAKRSASGVWEWAKYPEIAALPDALKRAMPKVRVAMDANGQVYVAGNYLGDIKFTNTPSELNPPTLTSANIPQDLSVYFYDTSLENEGYLDLDSSILNNRADFTLGFRAKIAPGGITNKSFASAIPYGTVLDAVNPDGKHEFSVHFRTNNILTVYSNAHGWEVRLRK